MDKKLFKKLVRSMKEMKEIAAGRRKPSRVTQVDTRRVKAIQPPNLPQGGDERVRLGAVRGNRRKGR